ncbi:BtrH N-terminal domain-containing protein [Actinokineospora guangxiensis]|uniref:BtrH N-terminal domain-containing protein n=1 Tax=Actinokineospora guangxiensis TaxID=1490288 RepID=A0ABW0EPD0_9PSEU
MTSKKQLKSRIRARMAKTGERYAAARAHVAGSAAESVADRGWPLAGGTHPESAALAALLRHAGAPIDEALVFGIGGGIGAGYILWEFAHDDSRVVTMGFTHRWQYIATHPRGAAARLGVELAEHTTGGAKGAAKALAERLPAMVWPDRYHVGYWHLPAFLDGHGGHPVVAYAIEDGRVRVDDRNTVPLTVAEQDFHRARARVGSYKNLMISVPRAEPVSDGVLRQAVLGGLAETVGHLSAGSDSFSLPAWRKWARMMTDRSAAKGWPTVFADRVGLVRALASVWEGVSPFGMDGGSLRPLFADFLDRAAEIAELPALADEAGRWRGIGAAWQALGDAALPPDVPEFARLRELTVAVTTAAVDGDEGADERASAATELWELRAELHRDCPVEDVEALFADLGGHLRGLHEAETAGVAALRAALE